ncbi:MAG: hypothetical protein HOH04_14560 [Rhodospirillaceae bacterium]|jgi:hypothetical protein|nr:hypothetical protein [Rhodospirillaceae bacterium]
MKYIRDHWHGDHSLHWSLWVNLVLIRVLIFYADRFTLPPYLIERPDALLATIVFMIISHCVIYPWQIVGLLRASERQSMGINSSIWQWASYMAIVISLVFTLISLFGAYQILSVGQFSGDKTDSLEQDRADQYALRLSADGSLVHIQGIFALGITEKLEALLDRAPEVSGIVLHSDGGHIYEGRGSAYLIKRRRLDTYVYDVCKSACTTVFIGGKRRFIGARAKLGFHQYGLEQRYVMPRMDLEQEQKKDISFYRQQSIAEDFLTKAFKAQHRDIWFPSVTALLDAGVVHKIVDEPTPNKPGE